MEEFLNQIEPFTSDVMGIGALMLATFTSIFSVANPIAALPVFLTVTEHNTAEERSQIAKKTTISMFFILLTFLLAGTYILSFFGISIPAIRIAGGMIILRAGYSMLNPEKSGRKLSDDDEHAAQEKEDPSFSPLAIPLLSGPGSIAVVIGFGAQAQNVMDYGVTALAVLITCLITYALLQLSPKIMKVIGQTGMTVMTRLMGFIALTIGVQFIINGIGFVYGLIN